MPIRRIDTQYVCGVREIANMCEATPSAVTNWRARYDDFPAPLAELECGPVFYWPQVLKWLRKTGRST
jgi:chromosome partitioning protein